MKRIRKIKIYALIFLVLIFHAFPNHRISFNFFIVIKSVKIGNATTVVFCNVIVMQLQRFLDIFKSFKLMIEMDA